MKRYSYCAAEYPDDTVMCAFDHTPFEPSAPAESQAPDLHLSPGQKCFFTVFAAVFLLSLLTSVLMALFTPDKFGSTAEIDVDLQNPQAEQFVSGSHFVQAEFKVIKSHAVLSKAVDTLDLRNVWGNKYNRGRPLSSDRAEAILRRNIDLDLLNNTRVVEVSAFSRDPDEAARLANGVVDACQAYKKSLANGGAVPRPRAVTVIAPAAPELRAFRPNRRLIIVLGIIIGIVFGSIAAAVSTRITVVRGRSSLSF